MTKGYSKKAIEQFYTSTYLKDEADTAIFFNPKKYDEITEACVKKMKISWDNAKVVYKQMRAARLNRNVHVRTRNPNGTFLPSPVHHAIKLGHSCIKELFEVCNAIPANNFVRGGFVKGDKNVSSVYLLHALRSVHIAANAQEILDMPSYKLIFEQAKNTIRSTLLQQDQLMFDELIAAKIIPMQVFVNVYSRTSDHAIKHYDIDTSYGSAVVILEQDEGEIFNIFRKKEKMELQLDVGDCIVLYKNTPHEVIKNPKRVHRTSLVIWF